MPLKLNSHRLESTEARIEIIPLIDIMFFLLAAFMLVSLSMVRLQSVPVNLPGAATASPDSGKDLMNLSVDASGGLFLDQTPMGANELSVKLAEEKKSHPTVRILIRGDQSARHGDILKALDLVRLAGIERVAFETRERGHTGQNSP